MGHLVIPWKSSTGSSSSASSQQWSGGGSTSASGPRRTGRAATATAAERRRAHAAFWSLYAALYDAIWDSPLTRALADAADAHTREADSIVDLGCGTGLMTSSRSAHVTGVDASAAMLRRAVRKGRIRRAVQEPVEDTGLHDAVADAVLLCNVLHLHPAPDAVLREAERLCRPGGAVFLCWPLDGIDTATVYRADRQLGRGLMSARSAHMMRALVGITAALTGTRRIASSIIEQAVFASNGLDVAKDAEVAGCQRVVVLRKHSSPPSS